MWLPVTSSSFVLFFIFSNPKHCGLLDKSSLPSRCLFDSSVVVRSFKKPGKGHSGSQRNGFSKCAAFQFLEILQDLTKVYSSCLEEEADQLLFFPLPLQWEASRSCSQSGQCDMCSEWNENIGHCHLLVGLSQYQQNEVQWCISSFFLFLFLEHLCALKPHARICICVITSQSEEEHCWPSMFLCWTFYGAEEQDEGLSSTLFTCLSTNETELRRKCNQKWKQNGIDSHLFEKECA